MLTGTTKRIKIGNADRSTRTTNVHADVVFKNDGANSIRRISYQSFYRTEGRLIGFNEADMDHVDVGSGEELVLEAGGFVLTDALAPSGKGSVDVVIRAYEVERREFDHVPLIGLDNKGFSLAENYSDFEFTASIFEVKSLESRSRRYESNIVFRNCSGEHLEHVRASHGLNGHKDYEDLADFTESPAPAGGYAILGLAPIDVPKKSAADAHITLSIAIYRCVQQFTVSAQL